MRGRSEAAALSLPKRAWRTVAWREGTNKKLRSRFARVRVRASPIRGEARFAEETLLIEWPKDEAKPTKYWLATVDPEMPLRQLVDIAKMRWRIEHDYRDLKQEIGLGHYEGRGWTGFHHHGTLSIAAYGFLISERERIPPSGPCCAVTIQKSPVPSDYRPRGAPRPATTSRPELDRDSPLHVGRRDCSAPADAMPMLPPPPAAKQEAEFVTQYY
jgi:Transposase DDE domain